jgi:hypothetical protein
VTRLIVELHPEAAEEARDARRWYRLRDERAAAGFIHALDGAIEIEKGDESGGALHLSIEAVAEKFIRSYWRQVAPYIPPGSSGGILRQNTGTQAEVVRHVLDAHAAASGSLTELLRNRSEHRKLVRKVAAVVVKMPLFRLQRLGQEQVNFLYADKLVAAGIELRPGVAFCLRRSTR